MDCEPVTPGIPPMPSSDPASFSYPVFPPRRHRLLLNLLRVAQLLPKSLLLLYKLRIALIHRHFLNSYLVQLVFDLLNCCFNLAHRIPNAFLIKGTLTAMMIPAIDVPKIPNSHHDKVWIVWIRLSCS